MVAMTNLLSTGSDISADALVQQTYHEIEQELGFGIVPNIFRSMSDHPVILAANWQKFKATILGGQLPRSVKEMLGVAVSHVNGSEYAKQVHLHSLSVQGVHELWLQQLLADELEEDTLPETILAMVVFARKAARRASAMGVDDINGLRDAGLSDTEIFEVIATVDLFQSVNAYTDLMGVEIDNI
jgi:uncharacterized peroxidase-related enzyme